VLLPSRHFGIIVALGFREMELLEKIGRSITCIRLGAEL
jgi:hypothetical protein